ncbi:MAG: outer membrane beta-barrel protein [candidate division Zixibacteria bacterium]|nr:outer membrane beta-barrel protein [candidate division Zixibacteria bacterium]
MRQLKIICFFSFAIICFLASTVFSIDVVDVHDKRMDANYSMVGVRLGVWADQGGDLTIADDNINADFPDVSFFSEVFYAHRFTSMIMGELSLGVGSRGEATIVRDNDQYIGTINIYPLLLQAKLTPLSGKSRSFHPYITAGGGVVFGRYSPQIIRSADPYYDRYFVEKTETDFLLTIGGGLDLAVNEQFGLNFSVKYYPIKFTNGLTGVKDYSGVSFAIGFSYHIFDKDKI